MNAKAKPKEFDNGLELIPLKSTVASAAPLHFSHEAKSNEISKLIVELFAGTPEQAVFYFDYGIRFAKWEKGNFVFHDGQEVRPEYLQLARIFNEQRELKIWRVDEAFYYRLRIDDESGAGAFAVDAEQNLWGTHVKSLANGWTRLWEDRGTEVIVPFSVSEIDVKYGKDKEYKGELACLKTRNYIGTMANGQATYVDCRFVALRARTEVEVK